MGVTSTVTHASKRQLTDLAVAAALVDMFDVKTAVKSAGKLEQIKYFKDGEYKTYEELGNKVLKREDLNRISIDTPGGTKYFKRITTDEIDKDNEIKKPENKGFKGYAYCPTNKDGELINKDGEVLKRGSTEAVPTYFVFPGYTGNPLDSSPQTKAMYAVGNNQLYPPIVKVDDLMNDVRGELKKQGFKNIEVNTVSHSMGCVNAQLAIVAAYEKGIATGTSTYIEPIGGALGERKLADAFTKDTTGLKIDDNQRALKAQFPTISSKNVHDALNAQAENSLSVRAVKFEKGGVEFSHVAYLRAYQGDDLTSMDAWKFRMGNRRTAFFGEEGIPDKTRCPDNQPPKGEMLYMDMTGEKNHSGTLAAKLDSLHSPSNIFHKLCDKEKPPVLMHSLPVQEQPAKQEAVSKKQIKTSHVELHIEHENLPAALKQFANAMAIPDNPSAAQTGLDPLKEVRNALKPATSNSPNLA